VQGHPHVPGFLCSGCGVDRTHPVLLLTLLVGLAQWHSSVNLVDMPEEVAALCMLGAPTGCGLNPLRWDRRRIFGGISDIILAVAGGATGRGLNPLGWDRWNIFGGSGSAPDRLASCWGRYGLWPEPPTAGPTEHPRREYNDLVKAVARGIFMGL